MIQALFALGLTGAVVASIAGIARWRRLRRHAKGQGDLILQRIAAVSGIFGVMLVAAGWVFSATSTSAVTSSTTTTTSTAPTSSSTVASSDLYVSIDAPAEEQSVSSPVDVSGKAFYVPTDRFLWFVVLTTSNKRFYPKVGGLNGPIAIRDDGSWSVSHVDIGASDTPSGEKFIFQVYETTAAQSVALFNSVQPGSQTFLSGIGAVDAERVVATRTVRRG